MLRRLLTGSLLASCLWLSARPVGAQTPPARPILRPTRYELNLAIDLAEQQLAGSARIELLNAGSAPVERASFTLYRLLTVRAVKDASGRALDFTQQVVAFEDEPRLQVTHVLVPLARPLAPGQRTTLELGYDGYLAGYVETGMLYVQDRVDSAFTIVRPDAQAYPQPGWPSDSLHRAAGLPAFDYVARVTVPATHVVANGGELVSRTEEGGRATYVYRNLKPAWRMDFAVARFGQLEAPGLRVFYLPGDSAGGAHLLAAMQNTLALYTRWFGPLQGSPGFTVIEIPDGWGSQADVSSILQTAAAFRDPGRTSELYHEIAHLWNPPSTETPGPRWNEGFATFMESLAIESLEGRPALDSSATEVADRLRGRLQRDSTLRTLALVDFNRAGKGRYTYSVGMLTFYGLYRLAGPAAFRATFRDYYARYHASGGSTAQLAESAQRASKLDLAPFLRDWLFTPGWAARLQEHASVAELFDAYAPRRAAPPAPRH